MVLNPGDFYFGGTDTRIHTLLGSCVSVTLWHPLLRAGGMCHYMLPQRRIPTARDGLDGRYADHAVQMFLEVIERLGTKPQEYVAHLYGGGNQFPPFQRGRAPDVARDNIAAGLTLLKRFGFRVAHADLGGTGPRRLSFEVATGEVTLTSAGGRRSSAGGEL
ncbi:chemotaxis protein CheD [Actinoplanes subtropicus]|uniref:chemotaxis protein CheD n=1 Tax=Actinoplanes subtropicus TaxID=543632 RepID=UPI000689D4F1|nr:chemotaxis protein CheD [Actinoplanes subtropicus]